MLCDFTFNHFEHGGWIQVSKTNLNNEMGRSRTMKKIVEPAHLYLNPTFQGQLIKKSISNLGCQGGFDNG